MARAGTKRSGKSATHNTPKKAEGGMDNDILDAFSPERNEPHILKLGLRVASSLEVIGQWKACKGDGNCGFYAAFNGLKDVGLVKGDIDIDRFRRQSVERACKFIGYGIYGLLYLQQLDHWKAGQPEEAQ